MTGPTDKNGSACRPGECLVVKEGGAVCGEDCVKQCASSAGGANSWVNVNDLLPTPGQWVLAHNGAWTGVGMYVVGDDVDRSERWQSEAREFIEHLGPKVTHWMPMPSAPNAALSTEAGAVKAGDVLVAHEPGDLGTASASSHVASPNDCVRSTPEHVRDHADQHELSARANVEERDDVKKLLKAMDVDSVEEALAVVEHEQWLRSTKPSATRDTKAKGLPDYPLKPVAGCKWPGCDCPGRWDCNATTERGAKNG
jgi:hypothetical protein